MPFPSPRGLAYPGIKPGSLALQADSSPCVELQKRHRISKFHGFPLIRSMRALLGQGSGLVWELSLGSDCHLREQGGPHSQDVFGNVHGSGKKGRKKMNSSLWFGCLDDGSSKQRTTQTSNPVGWKEERMGRSGKQNWKDTWGFRHLILIWVGNHFFPHLQEILRTRAGYWLRTPYNLTQF